MSRKLLKIVETSHNSQSETRRVPKRKKHVSEGSAADAMETMTGKQKFKVNFFNVIINQLNSALKKRMKHIQPCSSGLVF